MSRVSLYHMLNMEVVMNATLAGGVIIASCCEMIFNPGYAILIGGFAGIVSALGYIRAGKVMSRKMKMHDSCGI